MSKPPAKPQPLPRVVELVRVSTQGQADRDTPEVQRRALDALRQRRPGAVVERLEELGVSGALSVKDRPALRRLSELAEAHAFDELRVYALDRITRADDPMERFAVYSLVRAAGAVIVDASGRALDPREEMGEIDWFLQTWGASRERKKITQRTMDGKRRALAEGRLSQGSPPYGRRYDRTTRAWVLVPEQAEVYREIIHATIAGTSTRRICADLNARGIPPPRALRWGPSTIKRLIRTEACVGRYVVSGHTTQIPPIVSESEWRAARAALARAQASPGPRPTREALLRGLVRCAHCGRRMRVESDGASGPTVYACPKPRDLPAGERPCADRVRHRAEDVDAAVRETLREMLARPDLLAAAVERASSVGEVASARLDAERARVRIAKASEAERRVLRLLDVLSEEVARERLASVRAEADAAHAALRDAEARIAALERPRVDVAREARRLARVVERATAEDWREVLRAFVPPREPFGLRLSRDREISGLAFWP